MKHLPTVIAIAVVVALDVVFVRWVINSDGDAVTQWAIGLLLGLVSVLSTWATVRLVAAAAKGRLEIDTPDGVLSPGDRLDGTVTVHARRQLDADRLTVSLVATVTTRSSDSTTTHEIFRSQHDVAGAMMFASGSTTFPFTVTLPDSLDEREGIDLSSLVPEALSGLLSSLPSAAPDWFIEVELPVPGVDLVERVPLRTNATPQEVAVR